MDQTEPRQLSDVDKGPEAPDRNTALVCEILCREDGVGAEIAQGKGLVDKL